ncbi:MAG: DUF47 domain-containing protein [[Clostridium] leptum]
MSKKQDSFYFENFISCADYACQAAHLLAAEMENFDPNNLRRSLDEIHAVEHAADEKKHDLLNVLAKAFMTPIEREDILQLSQNIDEVTDKIEDVLLRIYYNDIKSIQPDSLALAQVVIRCCEAVKTMMAEFSILSIRKACTSILYESIQWRRRPTGCLLTACTIFTPPARTTVIAWREIYSYLEKCADACEHVANVVETS